MLRTLFGLGLVCMAGIPNHASFGQVAAGTPSSPKVKTAAEEYQNIQILKQIPADQLMPAMQFINYSLGVECSFCHVEGAAEKDDKKPKQTARKMMQMLAAINRDNFDSKQEVTCNSCHRGSRRPVAIPAIAENPSSAVPVDSSMDDLSSNGNVPPAEQIISKYVEAIGGEAVLTGIQTRVEKGTINIGGHSLPIEVTSKTGGKQLTFIHLPNGNNIVAYDGASGWMSSPSRPVHDIPSVEVASAQSELDLQFPLHVKQLFQELKTLAPQRVGDREAYVVAGINSGEIAAKFYFDKESAYLLRLLRYTKSPLGPNPTQIDFSDYREQDRLKLPFQQTITRPNSRMIVQIDEVKFNLPADDSKFSRPPASGARYSH